MADRSTSRGLIKAHPEGHMTKRSSDLDFGWFTVGNDKPEHPEGGSEAYLKPGEGYGPETPQPRDIRTPCAEEVDAACNRMEDVQCHEFQTSSTYDDNIVVDWPLSNVGIDQVQRSTAKPPATEDRKQNSSRMQSRIGRQIPPTPLPPIHWQGQNEARPTYATWKEKWHRSHNSFHLDQNNNNNNNINVNSGYPRNQSTGSYKRLVDDTVDKKTTWANIPKKVSTQKKPGSGVSQKVFCTRRAISNAWFCFQKRRGTHKKESISSNGERFGQDEGKLGDYVLNTEEKRNEIKKTQKSTDADSKLSIGQLLKHFVQWPGRNRKKSNVEGFKYTPLTGDQL